MILIPSVEDEVFAQVDQSCKCNISHQCPSVLVFYSFLRHYYIEKKVKWVVLFGTKWLTKCGFQKCVNVKGSFNMLNTTLLTP